jgi:hypothetical protein
VPRSDKIAEIHAQRAKDCRAAEDLRGHLSEVGAALVDLERVRTDLLPRLAGEAGEEDARNRLLALATPLRDLSDRVARERSALERVLDRLRRPTLNIGMVGRARQGKSQFLQSLTGLGSSVIPAGQRQFCTGVPSLIQHTPGGVTYADVFFHSTSSFLSEVIGPYYEQLGLGRAPADKSQFGTRPLPPMPAGRTAADDASKYKSLTAYHEAFAQYRDLIDARSPLRVGEDEIRRYVAQDTEGGDRQHLFRAVRRVHIYTAFGQDDLGGLGVIDLPGLGDTNLRDSRLLLSALEGDVDLVIFLRQPNPGGDSVLDVDVALYDTAQSALPEIPMDRGAFLILNHWPSSDPARDNKAQVEDYGANAAGRGIRVVDSLVADCANREDVYRAFNPVVDYLLGHIGELDQLLLTERTRRIDEIYTEARLLTRDAATLSDLAQPSSLWFPLFQTLFEEVYQDLAVGIEKLTNRYRAERDVANNMLAEAVAATVQRAREDDGIPPPEAIASLVAVHGSGSATYDHLLDEIRAHLSRHFLNLDTALEECVRAMWQNVADVLRESGGLGSLSDRLGRDFLIDFAGQVQPTVRLDQDSEVRYALGVLTDFELSYRGFIQHRVRPCLDGMNADEPTVPYPQDGSRPNENVIRQMLHVTYQEALFKCESALNDLLAEPSGAVFAIVEEFRDRVLRAHRIQSEWRAIYQEFRAEIWPQRFAALGEQSADLHAWTQALAELDTLLGRADEQ